MKFGFCISTERMEITNSGTVWGDVWVHIDGHAYPEVGWNDLPVAFAIELITAVREVASRPGKAEVRFFDWPFWIVFETADDGACSIRSSFGDEVALAPVEFARVVGRVDSVARSLAHACISKGWGDQIDVRRLTALVQL